MGSGPGVLLGDAWSETAHMACESPILSNTILDIVLNSTGLDAQLESVNLGKVVQVHRGTEFDPAFRSFSSRF
jgi:hypothetical protein